MRLTLIFSSLLSLLFLAPGWSAHLAPCKLMPCPTYQLSSCLTELPSFEEGKWEVNQGNGICGPGWTICDFFLCSHYQGVEVKKVVQKDDGQERVRITGGSAILCLACLFVSLSSEVPKKIEVTLKEKVETSYDQCQICWCCGHSDGNFDGKESCACHFLGNGPVTAKKGKTRTFNWLCWFKLCCAEGDDEPRVVDDEERF